MMYIILLDLNTVFEPPARYVKERKKSQTHAKAAHALQKAHKKNFLIKYFFRLITNEANTNHYTILAQIQCVTALECYF